MTTVRAWILIALVSITNIGCGYKVVERVVVKDRLVPEPKYKFEKINLEGAYMELGSKEVQRVCTPKLLEMNEMYRGVIGYYEWQIDEYMKKDENRSK